MKKAVTALAVLSSIALSHSAETAIPKANNYSTLYTLPCGDYDGDGHRDVLNVLGSISHNNSTGETSLNIRGISVYSYVKKQNVLEVSRSRSEHISQDLIARAVDLDSDGDDEIILGNTVYDFTDGTTTSGK